MRFKTKKQKNGGRYQRIIVSCSNIFLFISISAHCVLLGWNQRAKKKEGRVVSELTVTSLRKPMRFETKKRKNGGAGGGTLPQRGATGGGVRQSAAAGCGGIAQWQIAGA